MPTRRPYRLGKRQASVDQTRHRILMAAVAEYSENGIDDTTMLAVARRADVAPGTVLYHYPAPEALAEAVATMWIEQADLPAVPEIHRELSLSDRADLLVSTVLDMYDEEHPAAAIYLRNPAHPAMRKLQSFWDGRVDEVVTSALRPYLSEADRPLIAAIISGQFLAALGSRGIHGSDLRATVSRLIAAWLTSQADRP